MNSSKYDTDKISYLEYYQPFFSELEFLEFTMLEIGVLKGGSLLLWHSMFPKAHIVGIDLALPTNFPKTERITLHQGSQIDLTFLDKVALECAPNGFDFIIDDASHYGEFTKCSFWHLFENYLNPGGIYAIEDWGTGYWEEWPDGKSLDRSLYNSKIEVSKKPLPNHSYGMVGFVKQLIDEQGAADISKGNKAQIPLLSKFKSVTVTPYIVFVTKAN